MVLILKSVLFEIFGMILSGKRVCANIHTKQVSLLQLIFKQLCFDQFTNYMTKHNVDFLNTWCVCGRNIK